MKIQSSNIKTGFVCIFILLFHFFCISIYAQETNTGQQELLLSKITELLGKYEQYGRLTTDGIYLDGDYVIEFYSLFDKVKFKGINDDLSLKGGNNFSTPEDYVAFVRLYYPQGLDQTLGIANIELLETLSEKGIYRIIVKVRKQLTGLYERKELHIYDNDMYFFIKVPVSSTENISEYKIYGILSQSKYESFIAGRKSKGLYAGINGAYDLSQIFNTTVFSSILWTSDMANSIDPGFELTYMFTNGFGLGTGFRMMEYGSLFTLENYNQTSEAYLTDIDGDKYYPVLKIPSLAENNTIKCYEIPFLIKTRMGKGGVKFYFDLGVVFSLINQSYFTLDGSVNIEGYYPAYDVTLANLSEYDFGTFNYTPATKNKMILPEQLISACSALGFSFNAGKSFLFKIGARAIYGLTDIGFDQIRHPGDFNTTLTEPVNPTILQSAGVEIGIAYKIF